MEENKVIMTLEQYTSLIIENNNLKRSLEIIKNKAIARIRKEIKSSLICDCSKEKVLEWLEVKNDEYLLGQFFYSWSLKEIAQDTYNVFTLDEIETHALAIIKDTIKLRLEEIEESEKEENE